MKFTKKRFGWIADQEITEYQLTTTQGAVFKCLNYGAIVSGIEVPDKNGNCENVVLGFDTLEEYIEDSPYFGALVGRVAGRIKNGTWETYKLTQNEGPHHIHGGRANFSQIIWDTEVNEAADFIDIIFTHKSPAGDNGYPGNLTVKVVYRWTEKAVWTMDIRAETDATTLFNPTNHTYFNLSGSAKRTILNHKLQIASAVYAEVGADKCPTGRLIPVDGTPYDFRNSIFISEALAKQPTGYDTPFKLTTGNVLLNEPESGRQVAIRTTREAVVVFSTTGMDEEYIVMGKKMCSHLGIALETQELPDAVHHPHFQSIVLKPGEQYFSQTTYHFSA
ncbi:aldose 1-epimerase [Carnobacterium alterfunditum]|uniref:Aldose 1-epimerase n=1 Tax=Carnobacterium alterfunditum TaxID=28230 RepID=A0A1N6HXF4_9LACT|nr:aldose epimerase family protein [Carnobacterium alterfunditum]SIO24421.1 aldose 1-epimerase [Carnobacterium alterfunditum]